VRRRHSNRAGPPVRLGRILYFVLLAEFRIFDEKYSMCQKIKILFVTILLNACGGFLSVFPYATPARASRLADQTPGSLRR